MGYATIPGVTEQHEVEFLDKMLVSKATEDGCWYPSVALDEAVKKDQKLGEIRDFFGTAKAEYFSDSDGVVLYLVTSLAILTNDPLSAVGVKKSR